MTPVELDCYRIHTELLKEKSTQKLEYCSIGCTDRTLEYLLPAFYAAIRSGKADFCHALAIPRGYCESGILIHGADRPRCSRSILQVLALFRLSKQLQLACDLSQTSRISYKGTVRWISSAWGGSWIRRWIARPCRAPEFSSARRSVRNGISIRAPRRQADNPETHLLRLFKVHDHCTHLSRAWDGIVNRLK